MRDYIKTMRAMIGHEPLLTVGCGAIIEDAEGRILLQRRTDNAMWGIPGGLMEIGETFEETVKREVYEETQLHLDTITLFGLYSGEKSLVSYPNGDQVFSVQIIFHCSKYTGHLKIDYESQELTFKARHELPSNLNPTQAPFILDWQQQVKQPIVK
ncbi:NUDIX hydrolase [Lysinibacillus piscis]|uniref:DNA mismatch repair protein MutT n=1 Tax=Lysinibacillus piscis TaxID=2518931 RepID=A0ABQ5NLX6_9BACI|nr:NUDIX domain-containing protein [Lysinibacillus sp. KH24]GLC89029.1 DNA mismatch repair protein MutT [Lysinibacillus sp. KH24]